MNLEKMITQINKRWYQGVIKEMGKKQVDTIAQAESMRNQLNERSTPMQEMLQTIADMSNEINELKHKISQ